MINCVEMSDSKQFKVNTIRLLILKKPKKEIKKSNNELKHLSPKNNSPN